MKVIAFFNNKGGVGKTSLVYHLAWMYAELELPVVAADFDPQANLSSMFLDEGRLETLWPDDRHADTVLGAVGPLIRGTGDIALRTVVDISDRLGVLVGDLGLSRFEDELGTTWSGCADGNERAFLVTSAFHRLLAKATERQRADVVLMDVGPNLGALNRAALIAADFVVVPLAPDLFSLQGLRNLGPTLRAWRRQWADRKTRNPNPGIALPGGKMVPVGYVIHQHAVRLDRPVKAYEKWMARIPNAYRTHVLDQREADGSDVGSDPHCLATLKHYRSLMPMAQEARKPIFHLKSADGALGAHAGAVRECFTDYRTLALRIARACHIEVA